MTANSTILIVDDDPTLLEMLSEQLQLHEEFLTSGAATAGEALEQAKEDYFAVILLDVGLPDMDGREVCRLMRRNGVTSPIIMLTGADTDADTILGLDAGANEQLGFDADERVYLPAAKILRLLGFERVRLMTNNPDKVTGLANCGITVEERVPHTFPSNQHNETYLRTKAARGGHIF